MVYEVDGYRVVEQLYRSRRSVVARAIRIADSAPVIIKQSAGDVVAAEALRRVQHEYDLLQALRGEGVIAAHEIARNGNRAALVVEAFGESLAAALERGSFSLIATLEIGAQLARALARIHAAGVIHKDVNPSNIVFDRATHSVKLIDFDIASRYHVTQLEPAPANVLEGTLPYMAPEQTGRLNRGIDIRTDLYSLGVTLYHLLTGRCPFDGNDALALVHAHLATEPARVDVVDAAIPRVVGDIVSKLLAKAPEHRYQTASGVEADLQRCREQLAGGGRVEPFALGASDVSTRFEFPDRLYGRDADVRALLEAFARTITGAVETVLVSGYSGIGKSSFVREIYASVTARRGRVAVGKFEQLHRDVPYRAVIAVLEQLLGHVLAEVDDAHARWCRDVTDAVGDDGPLVATALPAIARVIGAPPPAPPLDPETAQRRLAGALVRLVQRFARPEHPLVVFLDDMQWADTASLQLLTLLATAQDTGSLLLIEAYRDTEIDPAHPFAHALREHEKRGARVTRIALAPLDLADTTDLVADVLRIAPADATDIASVIHRKTAGNPFFLRQFMRCLHDDGHLAFDAGTGRFTCDVAAIEQANITDNVADLLARMLGKLPSPTREILTIAAAIGNRFDSATLAMVASLGSASVLEALGPALDADLIVARGSSTRLTDDELAPVAGFERYAFQHDRVQQAAYELTGAGARAALHASIGRILLAHADRDSLDERLFDIVHHLNLGLAHITDPAERTRLAELDLAAARRARRAGACEAAAGMLRCAREVVEWTGHYAMCFEVHHELAHALALAGQPEAARAILDDTRAHATPRDRATLEALDTTICIHIGKTHDAVACARRAAALLGIELPSDPAELGRQIEREIGCILAALAEAPIETWIDLPPMTDPDRLAAMALLVNCIAAAYQSEPLLLALITAKLVTLSRSHGNCAMSARGYAGFAIIAWTMGQYDIAVRFGQLGVDLIRRLGDHAVEPAVGFLFAVFASPWRRPIDESFECLRAVMQRGFDCGDIANAAYAALLLVAYRQIKGEPLAGIVDEAQRHRKVAARLGLAEIEAALAWYPWHARTWTEAPAAADGSDALDPDRVERALVEASSQSMLVIFRVLRLEQCYWRGDHAGVVERARVIAGDLASIPGSVYNAELRFYACLSALRVGAGGDPDIEAFRADLARYAQACPENFRHMSALVDAELARTRGDVARAIEHYDTAIDSAAAHGFLKLEALANELAGELWLDRDKPGFATVHYTAARDLYEHWGAHGKVRELELLRRRLGAVAQSDQHTTLRYAAATASTLDFATVLKASHAIASEIELDSLLVKIMEMIVENSGAQAGSIVLLSEGKLLVQASREHDGALTVSAGVPLAEARGISEGIVRYATRAVESVVLADATRHPTFRFDPYVQAHRPRSVLCQPIVSKERLIGAVYLENNLVAGAFTIERLDALGILVAQLAISIENAAMFARLASYRDQLEELVARRTQALTEANEELREQAIVRERMESELRLAQKLQSVGQLAAGVAHEMNTPIQFVGNSLEFLDSAFASVLDLVDTYRSALSAAPAASEHELRAAEDAADFDYVRTTVPEAFGTARAGLERMTKIVAAMKAFSHPDQQGQAPNDLNAAIEQVLAVAVNEYRYVAEVALSFGALPLVVCHPGEINQVLLNLVVNSAHAIADVVAGSDRRGTISITTRLDGNDTVLISIADTGCGIPAEIRDRVFDPFFTTKEVGRGTGQGLALARTAVVDRHGGSIEFESQPGIGTTFHVRLPVHGKPARAPHARIAPDDDAETRHVPAVQLTPRGAA